MGNVVSISELVEDHVGLDLQCLDRIYLNGYVPNLQVGGQVVSFMTAHLGNPIPSPAIMAKMGNKFRKLVGDYVEQNHIPLVRFTKGDRKADVMAPYLRAQERTGRSGIAAIGVAQEFQNVFSGSQRPQPTPVPSFAFYKADRRVNCYYFYIWDNDFGASFIKVCTYFPYPVKVWLNGHEWAKRQALREGLEFTELSNGFATCSDPDRLQQICDRLGPGTIEVFFARWMARLPLPLDDHDHDAGYWWELSMRQIEVSRTLVFDDPRRARGFFESLIAENLDLGRPENIELIFQGPNPRGRRIHLDCLPKTKVLTRGDVVSINAFFKHSRIKQYLKDDRALRIETVINSPTDLACQRRLHNLDELQGKGRAINTRILDTERAGQGCVLANPVYERVAQPTLTADGCRVPALRFGDPRVMALLGALCNMLNCLGFTNRSLRARVKTLLGTNYTPNQMSYDLARLRRNGLIKRQGRSNTYRITADGQRIAIFYTKVHQRLLVPLTAANKKPAPPEIRQALAAINRYVNTNISEAHLAKAA